MKLQSPEYNGTYGGIIIGVTPKGNTRNLITKNGIYSIPNTKLKKSYKYKLIL